jgi:hypothetical protein
LDIGFPQLLIAPIRGDVGAQQIGALGERSPVVERRVAEIAVRRIRLRVAAVAAGCDQARSRSAPSASSC